MKRTSFATLTLLVTLTTLAAPGCSSDATPDSNGGGSGNHTSAGTGNNTAGTPPVLVTAGSSNSSAGTAAGGSPGAGASSGGSAGATTGGVATGGAATGGAATGGTGGGGAATGGAGNPACPEKIDSKLACTMVVSCPKATCGVFKLGSKDCDCAAAAGTFTCTSCTYTGGETITQPPAAALPACASDDVTLEKNTKGCTKGDRCKSLDMTKSRFCACWDDPVDGGTSWDCDAKPSNWP